ncbi:zinc knuckle family protein [Kwoniella heveanensis BCC8398]|uniref:Zinc knuckle family protein n=1 Tax=Kwoniella heveanensis BCC8398 TaxID=1296120 RepID=A0A1B9GZI2_9TREE|nr:zinc knuckle family protein [Kwoniella heveanensis BCC8398]
MARFTSIGMGRKKFVASAAEEAATAQPDAGPSSAPAAKENGTGASGDISEKKKKKRRGRERVRGEDGKRVAIGEKKGPDAKKAAGGWTRDEKVARRAKLTAKHAEERKQRRIDQKNSGTTCFACRGVGHASKDCPNILLAAAAGGEDGGEGEADGAAGGSGGRTMKRKGGKLGGDITGGKCYRCNGTDHSLSACPEPYDASNPTPYATCYICLGTGHLASMCPSNGGKGIYVNGGSCKVCGSVAHRAKDCPDDKRGKGDGEEEFDGSSSSVKRKRGEIVLGVGNGAGADEDDFMVEARAGLASGGQAGKQKKKKHAPARNSERPMKRLREVDPSTGELGGRLEGGFHPADNVPIPRQEQTERIPLTGRKPAAGTQSSAAKPKVKVVAF